MPRRAGDVHPETRESVLKRLTRALVARLANGEGYADISVEGLARDAGLAKSTFYFYFEDKGALLAAATGNVQEQFLAAAATWFELPYPLSRDQLEQRLMFTVDAYREHEHLLGAVVDAASLSAAVRPVYRAALSGFEDGLAAHLAEGRRSGRLDPALDPARTAGWLVWTFERGLHQLVRGAPEATVRRDVGTLTEMIWRAVYAPT